MATYPEYVDAAMRAAQYERVGEEWFAEIKALPGLWGSGPTIEDARNDLLESLHDWIDVHVKIGRHGLPDINGVSILKPLDPIE
jgi:predicted RNase H-like HicB family nuclease